MSLSVHPSDTSSHPVLILDDEAAVLHSLRETLERAGYHVITSNSPLKALELVRDQAFSVIITDMRMPEMNGLEFLELCEQLRPDATRVLITAVLSLSSVLEAINRGAIYRFIPKPWLHEELLAAVENSVQRFMLVVRSRQLLEENEAMRTEQDSLRERLEEQNRALKEAHNLLARLRTAEQHRRDRACEFAWRILHTFDPEVAKRARRIGELAQIFARHGEFESNDAQALANAAWFCDLGLIAVPRHCLGRLQQDSSSLSDSERSLLQNHPVHSQALAALFDEDPLLGDTVRAHHERFDGAGFPDGLTGAEIPWPGRCLAVVAAWVEAELPQGASEEFLLRESGRRFDPDAVRRFLEAVRGRLPTGRERGVREILMDELRPGMIPSRSIYSQSGILLVAEGQALSPAMIDKIRFHHKAAPPGQRFTVYS